MIYYFAYGSNLHPMRLMERVPSAELVGVAKHPNHALTFHKRSNDGSSKCNMFNSESDLIYGAIYKLKPEHKNELCVKYSKEEMEHENNELQPTRRRL